MKRMLRFFGRRKNTQSAEPNRRHFILGSLAAPIVGSAPATGVTPLAHAADGALKARSITAASIKANSISAAELTGTLWIDGNAIFVGPLRAASLNPTEHVGHRPQTSEAD